MINEENSVLMKFDYEDELYEFLDDCLNIDYNELSIDLLKKYKNIEVMILNDGNGNIITSQANGAQRALDVGIDVAGVQIDPRSVGQYNLSLPTLTTGSNTPLQTNVNGVLLTSPEIISFKQYEKGV